MNNIKLTSVHNLISNVHIDYMHNCKLILYCTNNKITKTILKKMLQAFMVVVKKINVVNATSIRRIFVYKNNHNVKFKPSGVLLKKHVTKKFIVTFDSADGRESFIKHISIS